MNFITCYRLVDTGIEGKQPVYYQQELSSFDKENISFQANIDALESLCEECNVSINRAKLLETYATIFKHKSAWNCKRHSLETSAELKDHYLFDISPEGNVYVYTHKIGEGEFKGVYCAIDHQRERLIGISKAFAIKEINGKKCDTFNNEIVAISRIKEKKYRGLIAIYDVYDKTITSRYYCKGNLTQRIQKGNFFAGEKLLILNDIIQGLSFLHGEKIVHRDIKPENVLLDCFAGQIVGNVVLSDFGSSSPMEKNERLSLYMSDLRIRHPKIDAIEQKERITEEDAEFMFSANIDFWSLGITGICLYWETMEMPWAEAVAVNNVGLVQKLKEGMSQKLMVKDCVPDKIHEMFQKMLLDQVKSVSELT